MRFGSRHDHGSQLNYITTLKGIIKLARNPEATDSVFDIEDGLRGITATQAAVDYTRAQPGVAEIFAERYLDPMRDVEALSQLPEGSLGQAYAAHLMDNGFDANYYRKLDVRDDTDYLMLRIRQTHDIWHVVTGIGVDPIGEVAVKAVELAQTRRPMAAVICAGSVLQMLLKKPEQLDRLLEMIAGGYRLGRRAKPLVAQRWEDGWDKPLDQWREELDVVPFVNNEPSF